MECRVRLAPINWEASDEFYQQLIQIAQGSSTTLPLIGATLSNGMTAIIIILAMSFGLIVPKMLIDHFSDR
jgi:hypothetical protein